MNKAIKALLGRIIVYADTIGVESFDVTAVNIKGCEAVLKLRDALRLLNGALDDVRLAKNQEVDNAKNT